MQEVLSPMRIGRVTFKPEVCMDTVRSMLNPEMEEIFEKETWKLSKKFDSTWKQLFLMIQEISSSTIWLDWNKQQKILNDMIHVDLINLTVLSLDKNSILNTEVFIYLNTPNLQRLFIFDNNIVEIKSLRKTNFFLLESLKLEKNQIKNIDSLSQMTFGKNLSRLSLECWHDQTVQCEDGSSILKLQPDSIQFLWCNAWKRIKQNNIRNMIAKKYESINIVGLGR